MAGVTDTRQPRRGWQRNGNDGDWILRSPTGEDLARIEPSGYDWNMFVMSGSEWVPLTFQWHGNYTYDWRGPVESYARWELWAKLICELALERHLSNVREFELEAWCAPSEQEKARRREASERRAEEEWQKRRNEETATDGNSWAYTGTKYTVTKHAFTQKTGPHRFSTRFR